jgi:hypothetical protein
MHSKPKKLIDWADTFKLSKLKCTELVNVNFSKKLEGEKKDLFNDCVKMKY